MWRGSLSRILQKMPGWIRKWPEPGALLPLGRISLLQDGKVVAQTTANAEGSFELKVKRGNYELTAVYTDANGQLVHKTIQIKAPVKGLTVTL